MSETTAEVACAGTAGAEVVDAGAGAAPNIVFCVGSVLRGDDAAGPMLAKMLEDDPIEGWGVIDGGQTPEDDLIVIKRRHPKRVIVVDAAAMGLPVGEVRLIDDEDISTSYLMSSHSLPITLLLGEVRSACDDVAFVGIQPGNTGFYEPLSPEVLAAVQALYARIAAGADLSDIPHTSQAQ